MKVPTWNCMFESIGHTSVTGTHCKKLKFNNSLAAETAVAKWASLWGVLSSLKSAHYFKVLKTDSKVCICNDSPIYTRKIKLGALPLCASGECVYENLLVVI